MKDIQIFKNTMSSLEIAELTGKQHAHVLRDIRNMVENINKANASTSGLVGSEYHRGDRTQYKYLSEATQEAILNFAFGKNYSQYQIMTSSYTDAKGESRMMYNLNKKACLLLASGYDVVLRAKIIDRWEELETEKQSQCEKKLPQTYLEALKELVVAVEENERLSLENSAMKPKAEYFDKLVDRNLLTNLRDTAKELKIPQNTFISLLLENKYVYRDAKRKLKPYAEHTPSLFELKDYEHNGHTWTQLFVTPKGKETFRLMFCA